MRQKLIGIFVIVLLLVGAGYYLYENDFFKKNEPKPITSPTPTPPPLTATQQLFGLNNSAIKADMLSISSETQTEIESLPASVQFFIPDEINNPVQAWEVVFSDKSKGHKVVFDYNASVLVTHNFYRNLTLAKYELKDSARTNKAGILLFEDAENIYKLDMIETITDKTEILLVVSGRR